MILDATGKPFPKERRTPARFDAERGWESAQTNRLNRAHWTGAFGTPVNLDLATDLQTLRARCEYEAQNNAVIDGILNTYSTDLLGARGPTLQVHGTPDNYADILEEVWSNWWAAPEYNQELCGTDILETAIRQLWTAGEFLWQLVTEPEHDPDQIAFRLHPIHARRLGTPFTTPEAYLGVRRTATGKPISYFVEEIDEGNPYATYTGQYLEIPAESLLHVYRRTEPGQARGIPWLAPALSTAADLRDFDESTLDAARTAADYCVLLFTDHLDAQYSEVNDSTPIERRTISTLPPGYKPLQVKPEHPATNYVEFRNERMRELARSAGMPLMRVRLDSRDHNYSSARFDDQVYQRSLNRVRAWIETAALNRLVIHVAREAQFLGWLGPWPRTARLNWVWPAAPHVDPTREAEAEARRLASGTLSLTDACAAHGLEFEAVTAQRKRERELLEEAGLTTTVAQSGLTTVIDQDALAEEIAANGRR